MGWKQIPVGPFNLAGDSQPKLSADLDTNGKGLRFMDALGNFNYAGIIVKGRLPDGDPEGLFGSKSDLVAFDTAIGDNRLYKCDISNGSTRNQVQGINVYTWAASGAYYIKVLVQGLWRDSNFDLGANGNTLYSGENASVSNNPPLPSQSGYTVQSLGYVWSTDTIYIKPSQIIMSIS